jgi:ATP-dependent Clp endopeptidase proteolytic subunit ClpP
MPTPKKGEKEDDFVDRCIPIVIEEGTADDGEQAAAICHSIWEESKKKKDSAKGDMKMKWYEIKNKSEKAEIWIYEEIGGDFWGEGGITAKSFQKELAEIKASQIDMHINSPGGLVFDGITIYNLLKNHPANITTYIDGLAASIASVIALAGNKVIMAENALFMAHTASGMVMGTADDMRDFAEKLDKVNGAIATTYITKTGKDESEIKAIMAAETWMTADEALEAGFIDEVSGEMDMAACAKFIPVMQKAGFQHIPEGIAAKKEKPTAREAEKALRDVGFNQKQAKAILAEGLRDQRDADPPDSSPAPAVQRDADPPKKKDRIADLLTRAEIAAPSK